MPMIFEDFWRIIVYKALQYDKHKTNKYMSLIYLQIEVELFLHKDVFI